VIFEHICVTCLGDKSGVALAKQGLSCIALAKQDPHAPLNTSKMWSEANLTEELSAMSFTNLRKSAQSAVKKIRNPQSNNPIPFLFFYLFV
jgi:hypothetical protein